MRKTLSFKKVVNAHHVAIQNMREAGIIDDKIWDFFIRFYCPYILDHVFNEITEYPKSLEKINSEMRERILLYTGNCHHCGSPKKEIAGLARDTRGKIIRCPFHDNA